MCGVALRVSGGGRGCCVHIVQYADWTQTALKSDWHVKVKDDVHVGATHVGADRTPGMSYNYTYYLVMLTGLSPM